MKQLAVVLGVVLVGASVWLHAATKPLYTVEPAPKVEDAERCGKAGGRGALVFVLDADGNMLGEPQPYCIVPVK